MLMKTSNIMSLLSAALLTGALLLFAGCEKEKTVQPNDDIIENDSNILYGKVVAILDPCIGNTMIISVQNDSTIGSYHDYYNRKHFIVFGDTLFTYENVIAVPTPLDHEHQCRYYCHGKALYDIKKNDEIAFTYRNITSKEDTSLFLPHTYCFHYIGPPSNMRHFIVKEIVNYKSK